MKIATVFSGIGAPEYALKTYFAAQKPQVVFACDCGETDPLDDATVESLKKEKDPLKRQAQVKIAYEKIRKKHWIKETYFKNYSSLGISEEKWYDDIRFIDGNKYAGQVGLFIGGSPCQSFSNMGHRGGLSDTRGTLFYDYARLVKEIQPDVFIYENVPGMLVRDKGETWKKIYAVFKSLHYEVRFQILNSVDYGIPQNRRRLFVVGFKDKNAGKLFEFPKSFVLSKKANDYFENQVNPKYFLGEKGFRFTTTHKGRARVGMDVIRTEKRNQQFNWNGDFIFVPYSQIKDDPDILARAFVGTYMKKKGAIRKMTPLECHRLMGFQDDFQFCENDTEAYKEAGNSIVVDVIKNLIDAILKTGVEIK